MISNKISAPIISHQWRMDQFSDKIERGVFFSPDRNGYPTAGDGTVQERGVIVDSRILLLKKRGSKKTINKGKRECQKKSLHSLK